MQKLSKREKALLYALTLLLLAFVLFMLAVKPMVENYTETLDRLENIREQRDGMELAAAETPILQKRMDDIAALMENMGFRPAPQMHNFFYDRMLTDIMNAHGLTVTALELGYPELEEVKVYNPDNAAEENTGETVPAPAPEALVNRARATAVGTKEDAFRLAQTVAENEALFIERMSVAPAQSKNLDGIGELFEISLDFVVYLERDG